MQDFQVNVVPAENQNNKNVYIFDKPNAKIKILFAGNSITKHEPKPEIGWTNDCGMAATSLQNDYVHQFVKMVQDAFNVPVSYAIAQVAHYERSFFNETPDVTYSDAKNYNADLIICFYGANVPKTYDVDLNPKKTFKTAYLDMRNYLSNGRAKVISSMGFYIRPVLEKEKLAVCNETGDTYVDIDDIRSLDEAHGLFNHPSDLGMGLIAKRFFDVAKNDILAIIGNK
jgi:alpha-galactosidase